MLKNLVQREEWDGRETTTWMSRSVRKRMGRYAGAEIPLQPVVRQAVSLQHMEANGGADARLQPMENLMLE